MIYKEIDLKYIHAYMNIFQNFYSFNHFCWDMVKAFLFYGKSNKMM